ncbi:hypothetical protein B0H11DRAFT_2427461 [Mycena galericulata]|nr:hypothetical protein B0H11DRAFT_2427461 [Mycena galericulata]
MSSRRSPSEAVSYGDGSDIGAEPANDDRRTEPASTPPPQHAVVQPGSTQLQQQPLRSTLVLKPSNSRPMIGQTSSTFINATSSHTDVDAITAEGAGKNTVRSAKFEARQADALLRKEVKALLAEMDTLINDNDHKLDDALLEIKTLNETCARMQATLDDLTKERLRDDDSDNESQSSEESGNVALGKRREINDSDALPSHSPVEQVAHRPAKRARNDRDGAEFDGDDHMDVDDSPKRSLHDRLSAAVDAEEGEMDENPHTRAWAVGADEILPPTHQAGMGGARGGTVPVPRDHRVPVQAHSARVAAPRSASTGVFRGRETPASTYGRGRGLGAKRGVPVLRGGGGMSRGRGGMNAHASTSSALPPPAAAATHIKATAVDVGSLKWSSRTFGDIQQFCSVIADALGEPVPIPRWATRANDEGFVRVQFLKRDDAELFADMWNAWAPESEYPDTTAEVVPAFAAD